MLHRHIYEIRMEEMEHTWDVVISDQGKTIAIVSVKKETAIHLVKDENHFSAVASFITSMCEAIAEGDIPRLSQLGMLWNIRKIAIVDGSNNDHLPRF